SCAASPERDPTSPSRETPHTCGPREGSPRLWALQTPKLDVPAAPSVSLLPCPCACSQVRNSGFGETYLLKLLGQLAVVLRDDFLHLRRHSRQRLPAELHLAVRSLPDDGVLPAVVRRVLARVVVAELAAAALLAFDRRPRDGLGHDH